jgi:hypothetical protein
MIELCEGLIELFSRERRFGLRDRGVEGGSPRIDFGRVQRHPDFRFRVGEPGLLLARERRPRLVEVLRGLVPLLQLGVREREVVIREVVEAEDAFDVFLGSGLRIGGDRALEQRHRLGIPAGFECLDAVPIRVGPPAVLRVRRRADDQQ